MKKFLFDSKIISKSFVEIRIKFVVNDDVEYIAQHVQIFNKVRDEKANICVIASKRRGWLYLFLNSCYKIEKKCPDYLW